MSTIIFYENTSTMLYSTITKSSPSLRLAHLSSDQVLPPLPVNFLLGAGGPCHWSFCLCNLTIDCISCIECRLMLLSLLYIIDFAAVLLLLPNIDLIPCWLYFKMSFCGDCLKVVGHTSRFSLELGPVEDHHRSSYSVFLCCLPLSVFIFCSGFQDLYSLYPFMLQMYSP